MKFKMSEVNPCLPVLVGFYINDLFCVGNKLTLHEMMQELKKFFAINVAMDIMDCMGFMIRRRRSGSSNPSSSLC